jgi:hypothetical protein
MRGALFALALLAACREGSSSPTPSGSSGSSPKAVAVDAAAATTDAAALTHDKVFTDIYQDKTWGTNEAGRGHSGTGSTLQATVVYRAFLQQFMKDNGIKSVVDAGCGDWEFSSAIDWRGIDYRGFDIVASLVKQNTA